MLRLSEEPGLDFCQRLVFRTPSTSTKDTIAVPPASTTPLAFAEISNPICRLPNWIIPHKRASLGAPPAI